MWYINEVGEPVDVSVSEKKIGLNELGKIVFFLHKKHTNLEKTQNCNPGSI